MTQAALLRHRELERLLQGSQEDRATEHSLLESTYEKVADPIASRWRILDNTSMPIRHYSTPEQAPCSQLQASAVWFANPLRELWKAGVDVQVQRLLQTEEPTWRALASHASKLSTAEIAASDVERHPCDTTTTPKNIVDLE